MGFPLTPRSMTLDDLETAVRSNSLKISRDFVCLGGYNMEHCRSPDGVTSVLVTLYYTMLSRVYLSVS